MVSEGLAGTGDSQTRCSSFTKMPLPIIATPIDIVIYCLTDGGKVYLEKSGSGYVIPYNHSWKLFTHVRSYRYRDYD